MSWLLLKMLGAGKWVFDLLCAIGRWVVADWRNGALIVCAAMWAAHALILNPALRDARDLAQANLKAASDAHEETVKRYREAVTIARQRAELNVARVETAQAEITQEIVDDFKTRIADARARAARLDNNDGVVRGPAPARTIGGSAGATGVPSVRGAASGTDQATGEDRLPATGELNSTDALIATEQALQLQALIEWVARQSAVPAVADCNVGDCE